MSQIKKLTGAGMAPLQALGVVGDEDNGASGAGITATGSTQATAYVLGAVNSHVTTTAASTGVLLPVASAVGEMLCVINYGANSLSVYPPVGGKVNNGVINTAMALASNTMGLYVAVRDSAGVFNGLNYASK